MTPKDVRLRAASIVAMLLLAVAGTASALGLADVYLEDLFRIYAGSSQPLDRGPFRNQPRPYSAPELGHPSAAQIRQVIERKLDAKRHQNEIDTLHHYLDFLGRMDGDKGRRHELGSLVKARLGAAPPPTATSPIPATSPQAAGAASLPQPDPGDCPAATDLSGALRREAENHSALRRVIDHPSPFWGRADLRQYFDWIEAANEATESGGQCVRSRMGTSAGFFASYSRSQLLVRLQLGRALQIQNSQDPRDRRIEELLDCGITRRLGTSVRTVHSRGIQALHWYDAVARGEGPSGLGEAPAFEFGAVRALARANLSTAALGDQLMSRFGSRFTETTGLPPADLRQLARARSLARRAYQSEFHQAPGVGDRSKAEVLMDRHPDLRELVAASGTDPNRLTPTSLAGYLKGNNLGEDYNGWYTRAAATGAGWADFEEAICQIDVVTSFDRHAENFVRAVQVVQGDQGATGCRGADGDGPWSPAPLGGLSGRNWALLLGQMARMNHGGGGRFCSMFTKRGFLGSETGPPKSLQAYKDLLAYAATRRQHSSVARKIVNASLPNFTANYLCQIGQSPDEKGFDTFLPAASTTRLRERMAPTCPGS